MIVNVIFGIFSIICSIEASINIENMIKFMFLCAPLKTPVVKGNILQKQNFVFGAMNPEVTSERSNKYYF